MFKLPDEVKKEMQSYQQSLADLLAGKITPARFKGVRVPWGFYAHRGGQIYMSRIRIPAGIVSPAQLTALAAAAQKFGSGDLHLTSRQDIQIHNVKIEDSAALIEELQKFNLSPRGGGGNTVRNITACALAGICADEIFDVRPYAVALSEYLLAQENSFNLPRKFKIVFAGCGRDCSGLLVNDLGFLAKNENGRPGFKVFVGGGMGAKSALGQVLAEFIPAEEIIYTAEAVTTVFYKNGDRKNRLHNRLRFLIQALGWPAFKQLYEQELKELKKAKKLALGKIDAPQVRNETHSLEIRIPRGDITAAKLLALAALAGEFSGLEFRTSQNQNLFVCGLRKDEINKLSSGLKAVFGADCLYPSTLLDVTACKGAATCNLGLCNSPALAAAVEQVIKDDFIGTAAFKKLELKINGCPNSCGRHPIGKISFYGLVKRIDNRPVPFYMLLLGGRQAAEKTRLAVEVGSLPAKNVLAFLKKFLIAAEEHLKDGQDVDRFLAGEAPKIARGLLKEFSAVPKYDQDRDFYIDWGKTEEFSLAGIGPGECGAGVIDMIESDLADSEKSLKLGTPQGLYQSLILSARALLITRGLETLVESEILSQFKEKFVETGNIAYRFNNILELAFALIKGEVKTDEAETYVRELYREVWSAYQGMDSEFKFPVRAEIKKAAAATVPEQIKAEVIIMDLQGVACPINYVKAKIRLEGMAKGDKLLLYLDAGEPIKNVPASLRNDGQDVLKIEEREGCFEVLVKKVV